jgi:hypothetical protein
VDLYGALALGLFLPEGFESKGDRKVCISLGISRYTRAEGSTLSNDVGMEVGEVIIADDFFMNGLVSSHQWVIQNCIRQCLWIGVLTALIVTPGSGAGGTTPPDRRTNVEPTGKGEFEKPERSGLDNTPEGGTLPGGTVPGGTLPGGTLPGGTVPGGTVPGGTLPDETVPGGTLPGGTLPGGTVPSENLPGEDP